MSQQTLEQELSLTSANHSITRITMSTMTNFFTSVDLQESLLKDGVYSCGTYRKDRRGIPPELKNTKLGATYMYSTCGINT